MIEALGYSGSILSVVLGHYFFFKCLTDFLHDNLTYKKISPCDCIAGPLCFVL